MILYYKFEDVPYTQYNGEGYVIGHDTYDTYDYDMVVEVKAKDVQEFLNGGDLETIQKMLDNELFNEEDENFVEFMKERYEEKAFNECVEELE